MIFGYARVSTIHQNLDLQIQGLKNAKCEEIFSEKLSGSIKERPELKILLSKLRANDTLIVWRLDRLGRNLKQIIDLVISLTEKKVVIKGLNDGIDTSTANGRLFLHMMAVMAEYERDLIKERTAAGLTAARARGRVGGRPRGLSESSIDTLKILRNVYKDFTKTPKQIYGPLQISRATFYRYCKLLDKYTDQDIEKMKLN
jgi:DNA invertase Pin-like site-specific DNA recombinase